MHKIDLNYKSFQRRSKNMTPAAAIRAIKIIATIIKYFFLLFLL